MPPRSPEQINIPESNSQDMEKEKYLDVERGDVDLKQQNIQQSITSPVLTTPTNNTSTQAPTPPDPVQIVQKLISTGFTPTKAQIANAGDNLNAPNDDADHFFSQLLKRLIRLQKYK